MDNKSSSDNGTSNRRKLRQPAAPKTANGGAHGRWNRTAQCKPTDEMTVEELLVELNTMCYESQLLTALEACAARRECEALAARANRLIERLLSESPPELKGPDEHREDG